MKRSILVITVFLMLGAIVTVAIAWACAAYHQPLRGPAGPFYAATADEQAEWDRLIGGSQPVDCARDERPGVLRLFLMEETEGPRRGVVVIRAGWPLLALRYDAVSEPVGEPPTYLLREHGGWVVRRNPPGKLPRRYDLPYRPTWPGFVANTLLYGGVLWLMVCVPFALRRRRGRRRSNRGLCPKCAYPVGVSPVCTECGATVDIGAKRALVNPQAGSHPSVRRSV